MVVGFFTAVLPRLLGQAGVDFAVFDLEATGLTHERLEMLTALSRAEGVAPVVRVAEGTPGEIGRVLDLGAVGIMAPKVDSAEDAERVAAATHYPPQGRRGSGYQAFPSGWTTATDAAARDAANRHVLTICQLESMRAIEHAQAIVATPGVDVVNVGVNDLSAELGVGPSDARVRESVDRVRELAAAHGKAFLGKLPPADPSGRPRLKPGHRLVLIDHDTAALAAHTQAGVAEVRMEAVP
ncbi:aldolase/citrate lyase family protein [Micromonospora sp. NPDC005161]